MASQSDKPIVRPNSSEDLKVSVAHTKHENVILKTELLHTIQENDREQKEQHMIYHSKICYLENKIKDLEKFRESEYEENIQEQKHLQQLNLQLNQKLKLVEEELIAAGSEKERHVEKNLIEIAQLKASVKVKENELVMLKGINSQLDEKVISLEENIDKELNKNHELEIVVSSERHKMKMIKSRVDEIEHHCQIKIESANNQIDQYKGQIKSMESNFQKQLEDNFGSLEAEKKALEDSSELGIKEKRELERKLSEMKQNHLSESQSLLNENEKLLNRIKVLQQNQNGNESNYENLLDELQTKTQELNQANKEKALLQSQVNENKDLKSLLTKEKQISAELRQEISEIVLRMRKSHKETNDLRTVNEAISESLSEKEKALSDLTRDIQKERVLHQQIISDVRVKDEEQTTQYLARISSLESRISKQSGDYVNEIKSLKEKVKQYGALIKKLRFRLETGGIKEKELEARLEALKQDFVPSHLYRNLQHHLQQLVNKHSEFKAFIQGFENKRENMNQAEELSRRISSINEKFIELESVQNEAYSALETM